MGSRVPGVGVLESEARRVSEQSKVEKGRTLRKSATTSEKLKTYKKKYRKTRKV